MDVRVKFLGANRTVTGSKHLLDINGFRLMIDCGMFQGMKMLRLRNWEEFPVEPASIDAILLTHAHIDHTGYLPRLVRDGFSGPVFCTPATADLATLLLRDSAKLQVEEAEYNRRKGTSVHANPEPLYNEKDVERVLPLFRTQNFHTFFPLSKGVSARYLPAGHILGAAMAELRLEGKDQTKTILFSGDLGKYDDPLHPPPEEVAQADALFVESTYAGKVPVEVNILEELAAKIHHGLRRGGCVVIPAFAVGRTQMILFYLQKLFDSGRLAPCPVYVDSPMAIAATRLYKAYLRENHPGMEWNENLFDFPNLHYVTEQTQSVALNEVRSNAIIISASGMATGGRILHHLANRLPRKEDTVLFIGFQVEGSRGRDLLDRKTEIRIFGEFFPVYCDVQQVEGLSAHASRNELHLWLKGFRSAPKMTFVVHGEIEAAVAMKDFVRNELGWNAMIPEYLESYRLFSGI
jgi:metallo-beta-lactamase family protein